MQLQYYMFRFHHILPSQFRKLGTNEKSIVYAFMQYELEQRIKENTQTEER